MPMYPDCEPGESCWEPWDAEDSGHPDEDPGPEMRRCGCCEDWTDESDPYCIHCKCDNDGRGRPANNPANNPVNEAQS